MEEANEGDEAAAAAAVADDNGLLAAMMILVDLEQLGLVYLVENGGMKWR
jgi:hypothetical protein